MGIMDHYVDIEATKQKGSKWEQYGKRAADIINKLNKELTMAGTEGLIGAAANVINNAKNQVTPGMNKYAEKMASFGVGIKKAAQNAAQMDSEVASNFSVDSIGGAKTSITGLVRTKITNLGTDPFDDKGLYGGNQNDLNAGEVKEFLWFKYVDGEDKELYKFVKKNPQYKHYSEVQIHKILENINDHGCTYVSMANSIFNEYKGKEKEFEETFGFPMVGENGDLNFNMLVLDIYLETHDKVYLDEPEALEIYTDCKIEYYTYEDMEYFKKYHDVVFGDDEYGVNPSAYKNIKKEFEEQMKNGEMVVEFKKPKDAMYDHELDTCFASAVPNRLSHYCHEKGINVNIENKGNQMSNDEIKKALEDGNTVVFGAHGYFMEYEDGSLISGNIGGHEMTITGITPDGRYIVSSCGKKEYFDPADEENIGTIDTFYVIDYDIGE